MQNQDIPQDSTPDTATEAAFDPAGRIAELEQALEALKDAQLRERAELDNQRRRLQRDVEQSRRFANERLLSDLLPVFDSLQAGLGSAAADNPVREGLELTLRQLQKVAGDHGLVAVDPAGQPFNPEHHQAISTQPSADLPENTVLQVFQTGWLLNERLLRPALVVVSQGA